VSAWEIAGLRAAHEGFALGPVDLSLGAGETVAVLGENGAGKTTFLRAVAGLTPAAVAHLRRDGAEVGGLPPERRRAVYVPQGLALFPHRSVRQNVAYPLEIADGPGDPAQLDRLLERFRLGGIAHRRPDTLSAGEQQRVALARALAARPELLLWDEPWGALDILARDALLATLQEIREPAGLPLLLVTHDPTLAFTLADRWLLLEAGRVVALAPPDEVVAHPPSRFSARFAGFPNVFGPGELAGGPPTAFRSALAARAGPAGVALGAPVARGAAERPGDGFGATVERVEPTPDGSRLVVRVDGLPMRLAWTGGTPAPPRIGRAVRFDLDPGRIVPLGSAGPRGDGP
jgi:ABC-type Fe3+/spermidine/putrescine transport system ATPase subunit